MKILALLLLLLGALLLFAVGALSIVLFAMAFDAPGSADNPGNWFTSVLVFLPFLVLLAVLIFGFIAFQAGNYTRAVRFGSGFGIVILGGIAYLIVSGLANGQPYQASQAQAAEDARRYPLQRFIRPFTGGADTILIFPERIVAYRMPQRGEMPYAFSGPVGDLNESRDAIILSPSFDRRIAPEEFGQFVDEQGRRLTEVYTIR